MCICENPVSGRSRISQREEPPFSWGEGRAPIYYLTNYSQTLHENEEFLAQGSRGVRPSLLDLPLPVCKITVEYFNNLPAYFRQELKESRDKNCKLQEQIKIIQENSNRFSQQQLTDDDISTLKSLTLHQDISSTAQTIVKSVAIGNEKPLSEFPRTYDFYSG